MRLSSRWTSLGLAGLAFGSCPIAMGGEHPNLEKALALAHDGDCATALTILKRNVKQKSPAVQYWQGVCESKLQRFDAAAPKLDAVSRSKDAENYPDAAFLAGQAFYATQNFAKAQAAFRVSADRGYKPAASLYYVGYMQASLKDESGAIKTFERVEGLPDSTMKQEAAFQIGEVRFAKGKQMGSGSGQRDYFIKTVRPAYDAVIAMGADTAIGTNAASRIRDIDGRFPPLEQIASESGEHVPYSVPSSNPKKTANGTIISAKPYSLSISEDFKYDTNVINQANQTLTLVSYAGSPYEKTTLLGRYQYFIDNWIGLFPEIGADGTFYARNFPSVYGSDNTNITPALRTRWDYYAFGHRQASSLLEFEYLWGTRDYTENHTPLTYYQSSENIVFGERVQFFDIGPTTLKGHYKFYQNENYALGARLIGFTFEQDIKTIKDQMLIATAGYEYQRANFEFWNQGNYSGNFVYVMPHVYWGLQATVGFSLLVVDTMNQFNPRGYEWNTSPSLTITKYFGKNDMFSVNVNYAYTSNTSGLQSVYAYTKNVFGVGGNLTF